MKRFILILLAVFCIAAAGVDTIDSPTTVDTVTPASVDGVEMAVTVSGCVAHYSFESGALGTDNHTTNGNDVATDGGDPTADAVNYKEGSASIVFDGNDYCYLADGSLSSDFPGKNGTGNDTFSLAAWIMNTDTNVTDDTHIVTKYDAAADQRTWSMGLLENGTEDIRLHLTIGYYNGTLYNQKKHGSDLAANTWYFVCATFDNTDQGSSEYPYQLMVRDASCDAVGSDISTTMTLDSSGISIEGAQLQISGQDNNNNVWIGNVDDLMIFGNDKLLTPTECTSLCNGTGVSYD